MQIYISPEQYAIAEQNGLNRDRVRQRVNYCGWSVERAIREPLQIGNERRHHPKYWQELAKQNGIDYGTYKNRLVRGWGYHRAATQPLRKRGVGVKKLAKYGVLSLLKML